jgi:LuxR family maltose regulon positive regulatory protein
VGAAGRVGAGDGGLSAAGQRQDGAAAVLDQREGLAERAAWVPVGRDERDPQRLWLAVLGALRETAPGSQLVRELTAAPDLDGWAMVERLLKDLAPLGEPLWLILDDVHELGSDQARRQLELLLMRAG